MTAPAAWAPRGFEDATVESWLMEDEVALSRIRLWCEVLEDANPVYYDEDVARANGFERIIAPPAMVLSWSMRAEWRPTGAVPTMAERFANESSEFPHIVGLRSTQVHSRPLLLGEWLTVDRFVRPLSDPQETERGFGRRQVHYTSLRDESGREVSGIEFEALRLPMPDVPAAEEIALAEMPELDGAPAGSVVEAENGQVLPPLTIPVTFKRCIKWVAASRDFFEVHHDRDYARRAGAPDMYIGVHFFQGLVGRYVTDWAGPAGFLRRMEFKQWGRCFPGETATVVGRVRALRHENGRALAELEIAAGCDRGKLYDALATVSVGSGGRPDGRGG